MDWQTQVSMSKHAKPQKGPGDLFQKENTGNWWFDVNECIADAADGKVFKERRLSREGACSGAAEEESFVKES